MAKRYPLDFRRDVVAVAIKAASLKMAVFSTRQGVESIGGVSP